MTYEQVGQLDVLPQVLPDFLLRGSFLVDEITADLDVRAIDDGELGANFLNEGDQTRHLRVVCGRQSMPSKLTKTLTNEGNIHPAGCEGTALRSPSQTVLENPGVELIFSFLGQAKVRSGDALENVVVVLCCPEDARRRIRHIPIT